MLLLINSTFYLFKKFVFPFNKCSLPVEVHKEELEMRDIAQTKAKNSRPKQKRENSVHRRFNKLWPSTADS